MSKLKLTHHAQVRIRQRGFREDDADLVFRVGTRVADDAILLTSKDVARAIQNRKQEIQKLERLRGSKVIVEGETLITIYHETQRRRPGSRSKSRRYA